MYAKDSPEMKRSRTLYIFQAAFEYLISLLLAGSFLATLTRELGFSDSLTGILSSVISLGCLFQLLSIAFRIPRVKKTVIVCSVVNQLLFLLLYVLPLVKLPEQTKITLFVVLIVAAYLLYNFVHPKKIAWLMSLVEDGRRGVFTASKEIVSLLAGMAFSYLMGAVTDRFAAAGELRTAFMISAGVIGVLTICNTACLVFTVEEDVPRPAGKSLRRTVAEVAGNRDILRIAAVFVLYYIAHYAARPFYGSYQINELGFSLKLVSALSICGSVVRIAVSRFWGRYADRRSFAVVMEKCLMVLALSELCVIAAVPANGVVMFALYYVFHGVAMGGINSALTNMVFDYAPQEKRSDSLAVCQAAAGTMGFLATVCVSPLVDHIQNSGHMLLGVSVYAQQAATCISLLFTVAAIAYVRLVLMKNKR